MSKVKVWPVLGFKAIRLGLGGAWRSWEFARSVDTKGQGRILKDDLIGFMDGLGVPERTRNRWLYQALEIGLFTELDWKSGRYIAITGALKVAGILGADNIGNRRASIPLDALIEAGWRSHLWGALLATFHGRPVSRRVLEELTGVPKTSQIRYEEEIGVIRVRNYVVTETPYDRKRAEGLEDCLGVRAFPWRDSQTEGAVEARTLPNSYIPPGHVESAEKGQTRKINRALKYPSCVEAGGHDSTLERIFHDTFESAKRATRAMFRQGRKGERYHKRFTGRRAVSWSVA